MNASAPPAPPLPPSYDTDGMVVGIVIAIFSAIFTALSMVVNRYALAHAGPQRVRYIPFIVRPWMVWICAMALYNLGATVLATVAQLFIPLSLFACLFITLLVFNLIFARAMIGEPLACPKVVGAVIILAGAILTATAAPQGTQLQDEYRCTDRHAKDPPAACANVLVESLARQPAALAWMATLLSLTIVSVIVILLVERRYPARDLKRATSPVPPDGKPDTRPPPHLAPRWLERAMTFVYPASMGIDEGIAHLWMRAETAMATQCADGGCDDGVFATAAAFRWSASIATAFWLVFVFRRYEATVALPIEYGTATVVDVTSALIFFKEHEKMSDSQLARVITGCVICVCGIAIGQLPSRARGSDGQQPVPQRTWLPRSRPPVSPMVPL